MTKYDRKLSAFATTRQQELLEAVEKYGGVRKAAKALGISHTTIVGAVKGLKERAARQGWAPEYDLTHPVAPGQLLRGTSTLYKDGAPVIQWVKTSADSDAMERTMRAFALSLAEDVKGLAKPVKKPPHADADLLCVIPAGDPHFGMYAWWEDAGDNFDLDIAETLTRGAIDRLLASAPSAHTGLLLNLGDMFHADNQKNQSASGHQLDVDGRWAKVQQVGLRAMIYCVTRMLEKFQKVVFRINRGNHDGHSSYALALMLSCYFHNEPRVEVDLSPSTTWYYEFGKVLIGSTHGDTIKGKDMIGIMAADKPQAWGNTAHRYWYVGHVHHQDTKEYPGGVVEYFRTLAARDAWHSGQGYRAGRDMRLIVLHKEHGEIERHRCDVGMLCA